MLFLFIFNYLDNTIDVTGCEFLSDCLSKNEILENLFMSSME